MTSKPGEVSTQLWKPKLRKNLAFFDLLTLVFSISFVLTLRFPKTWQGTLNDYELRNIILSLLVLGSWLFFLWFNGSRDTNILGFGADEYKKLTNATKIWLI